MEISNVKRQGGVVLLEALIGILIFSIGALAMVAMYANSFTVAADSQYRMEANNHANMLLNTIWINADRTGTPANLTASIAGFQHHAGAGDCTNGFAGSDGTEEDVTNWVGRITEDDGTGLPGAANDKLQVLINGAT